MPQFILCDCCGKSVEDFESRLEYFKHLQIAEKCKNCDKDFLSKRDLNTHTKKVHGEKIKCDCCDKFFSNKSNLTAHLKNKESEWKPVVPSGPKEREKCQKTFKSG